MDFKIEPRYLVEVAAVKCIGAFKREIMKSEPHNDRMTDQLSLTRVCCLLHVTGTLKRVTGTFTWCLYRNQTKPVL